jgi:hypothetical protein
MFSVVGALLCWACARLSNASEGVECERDCARRTNCGVLIFETLCEGARGCARLWEGVCAEKPRTVPPGMSPALRFSSRAFIAFSKRKSVSPIRLNLRRGAPAASSRDTQHLPRFRDVQHPLRILWQSYAHVSAHPCHKLEPSVLHPPQKFEPATPGRGGWCTATSRCSWLSAPSSPTSAPRPPPPSSASGCQPPFYPCSSSTHVVVLPT